MNEPIFPGRPPYLGLVCITASRAVRYQTVTRKRLLQLDPPRQGRVLRELYAANLGHLNEAIDFCRENKIRLYRMTSNLFPFADDPLGADILEEFRAGLAEIGRRAAGLGLRLLFHPDQYVVLNSDSPEVIENSVKILALHGRVMDLLELPRSPWALIEIHGGKGGRAGRLVETIGRLPETVVSRLGLENDERAYGAEEILAICRTAGVPMVFDAHHHLLHAGLADYDHPSVTALTRAARETWPRPEWQVVHLSNGREGPTDRRHSDLITVIPPAYRQVPWIEVEAKGKEEAIRGVGGSQ